MTSGIYQISNNATGKSYVGSACSFTRRRANTQLFNSYTYLKDKQNA